MTEFEFEELLVRVGEAMAPRRRRPAEPQLAVDADLPVPANDNELAWPLLPFPADWTASC